MTTDESPGPRDYICAVCGRPVAEKDLHGASTDKYPLCADIDACNNRIFEDHEKAKAAEAEAAGGDEDSAPAVAADPGEGKDAPAAGADPGSDDEGGSK
jgi:hypothetical protein